MIAYIVLLVVGLVSAAVSAGALFAIAGKSQGGMKVAVGKFTEHKEKQGELISTIEGLYGGMIDLGSMRKAVTEFRTLQEALKAERGRITITQAELETVETRLRELEEIERELEASGIETKEEINILEKKQADLRGRNESLQGKITESTQKLEAVMSEIELTAQQQEQIDELKKKLEVE